MSAASRPAPVLGVAFFFSIFVLGAYLILGRWLNVPVGPFLEWLIGLLTFWWVLIVVTVPWNIYFRAQEIRHDAHESRQKGIPVDEGKVAFVARWERRAVRLAIGLHAGSAIGLFCLSYFGLSRIGYISSAAVLLLTGLRPSLRAYEYLKARFSVIQEELKYPREDVALLRTELASALEKIKELEQKLSLENPESWASVHEARTVRLRQEVARLDALLPDMEARNQLAHETLAKDMQTAVSQLTADSKFLENVREIIRFVKQA